MLLGERMRNWHVQEKKKEKDKEIFILAMFAGNGLRNKYRILILAPVQREKIFFPFSSPGPKFEEAPPDFLSNQSHFSFLFFLSSQRRAKEGTFTAARQKEENSFEQLGGGFLGITFPPSSSAAHLSGYTVFHRFLIAKLAFYGPKNKNRLRPRLIFSAILFRIC